MLEPLGSGFALVKKIGGVGLAQHLDQGAYGQRGSDLLAESSGFAVALNLYLELRRGYSQIIKVHDNVMRKNGVRSTLCALTSRSVEGYGRCRLAPVF